MDKNSINDRFIESVNYLISNKLVVNKIDLAESLGIGNTKLSEILNKRMKAGTDLIACLCYKYSINSDWILIGRGSMLPNEQPQQLEQGPIYGSIPDCAKYSCLNLKKRMKK